MSGLKKIEYVFSAAKKEEASEILDIYHNLIGSPGCTWHIGYPDLEIIELDIKSESMFVLKEDSKIIAVAATTIDEDLDELQWDIKKSCDLARFAVIKKKQRQGVAIKMLSHIIHIVKKQGFDGIRMLVGRNNTVAIKLYEKNGFMRCGETTMYGLDFYCYMKKL